jgi:voltage-gated potassium channel
MRTLRDFEAITEWPMLLLAVVWLVLLIMELTVGTGPLLQLIVSIVWVIFIVEFAVRLYLSPSRGRFVRRNWVTLIALGLPALRLLAIFKAFRVLALAGTARGAGIIRIVGSLNRWMMSLGRTMGRRGFGYVSMLTLFVVFAGGAGMYWFEPDFASYGDALWWTAMMVTTVASGDWPTSNEGRILGLLLAIYSVAIFGYIAGSLASLFVEQDAASADSPTADAATIEALREEIAALRRDLKAPGDAG